MKAKTHPKYFPNCKVFHNGIPTAKFSQGLPG